LGWQYVFPSWKRLADPRSKVEPRHHLNEKAVSREVTVAVRAAGHESVETTMIYTHVLNRGSGSNQPAGQDGKAVRDWADEVALFPCLFAPFTPRDLTPVLAALDCALAR
jgi:hypothetical protein